MWVFIDGPMGVYALTIALLIFKAIYAYCDLRADHILRQILPSGVEAPSSFETIVILLI
ncbi:hypothetical protein KFK09_014332 [Dendrobium nobile]|uniref:Uncharacterized protein n=1 Tax=Dendrobium nobile TaxID=94219 RepID=A0A8T3B9R3_DENNO|nr:hypothetical protein KFK09_014332 [Dendrobium nobile]